MRRTCGTAIALTLGLALGACGSAEVGDAPAPARPLQPVQQNFGPLPAAERLAEDLLMIPVARDERGCVLYRMESASRPELVRPFYRTWAGDFSTIEEEAACS